MGDVGEGMATDRRRYAGWKACQWIGGGVLCGRHSYGLVRVCWVEGMAMDWRGCAGWKAWQRIVGGMLGGRHGNGWTT